MINIDDMEKAKQVLNEMMKGQYKRELNYAIKLQENPENQDYLKAEYIYYDNQYSIGKYKKELPFCLVSAGRNMMRNNRYLEFLKSIERQNYTNYQVVIVDDFSDDDSVSEFKKEILNSS